MPRITYNATNIDIKIGENSLQYAGEEMFTQNRSGSGKIETIDQYGIETLKFGAYFDIDVFRQLYGWWWGWARFGIHPLQRNAKKTVIAEAEVIEHRRVRSSSGQASWRPVILTSVGLLDRQWPIELTLASRDEMGFRMLLGRQAVRHRFWVDPGRSYYSPRPKRKKKVKKKRPAKGSRT